MSENAETLWREALQAKGPDWLKAQMQARPGRPDDIVFDVVFKEPYPTRAFCQQWCAEQDNKIFRFSGHSMAVLATFIVLVAFLARAILAWNQVELPPRSPYQGTGNMAGIASPRATPGPDDSDPTAPVPQSATADKPQTPSSLCGYITYQTDRCSSN